MNRIKYLLSMALPMFMGSGLFAAEGDLDTTAASAAVTKIQTAIVSLFQDSLIPALLGIIAVSVALWIIVLSYKKMKRGGNQS